MESAIFVKYIKMRLVDAKNKIDYYQKIHSTPIEYTTVAKFFCNTNLIEEMFLSGNVMHIKDVCTYALKSISDDGIWQCINLISEDYSVLIYTSGSAEILYYSII